MKNYLFAPFKDDEDKMSTWESCKSGIDQGIMIFLGRLESTYDVIISELKAEIKLLSCDDSCQDDLNYSIKLKAENKELKAENESLKEQVEDLMIDLAQAKKLRDKFGVERDDNRKNIDILKTEVKEKERQYHMLASSKSSHYPKEYKAEAEEYFEHNDHCKEVMFFMLDDTLFDDNDDFDDFINKEDAICVINNTEGSN